MKKAFYIICIGFILAGCADYAYAPPIPRSMNSNANFGFGDAYNDY